jgi:hypothetical protein
MTDWEAREFEVRLSFLGRGACEADVWADDPASTDPNRLVRQGVSTDATRRWHFKLASGGGQVVRFRPASAAR